MIPEVFTAKWAADWCAALNASTTYREAAAAWEGAVALVMTADAPAGIPEARAVYLDVSGGSCHGARVASELDLATARYVIEATPEAWRAMLSGALAPLMALMTGRLRLSRGNFAALLPYANAARELVATATAVPYRFPGDPG
jgi:putative sterol carrier protein